MDTNNENGKYKVLVVDDSEINRSILTDILSTEYDVIEAEDGEEAIKIMSQMSSEISLALMDIVMPKMNGFDTLVVMKKYQWIDEIPVIMISADDSAESMERAFDLGAVDYISRPFNVAVVHRRVVNAILMYSKQKKLASMVLDQIHEKEKQSRLMIDILSQIVEFRNGESGLHVLHIRLITEILLKRLVQKTNRYKLTQEDIKIITLASALHDVGKITIPGSILNKPGKLTKEEYMVMKTHAAAGAEMLDKLQFHQNELLLRRAYEICRWHHERYDGNGYPDNLKGEDIPISAQVVSIADVYDALKSERVYKKAFSHEVAVKMILNKECGVFNPILIECLVECANKIHDTIESSTFRSEYTEQGEFRKVAEDMLSYDDLPASERTLKLLEHERMKYKFYASMSNEIQFEYYTDPPMLTLSEWGASTLGVKEIISNPVNDESLHKVIAEDIFKSFSDFTHTANAKNLTFKSYGQLIINGEARWHQVICQGVWSEETNKITNIIGKAMDVNDTYLKISDLEQTASHDGLTDLLNHASAENMIQKRLKLDPRANFALLLLDLDFFKQANDKYGHLFGDHVLQHLAGKIKHNVRGDDIAARMGGDEFLIFIQYKSDLNSIVSRIYKSLLGEYEGFKISISMGVSTSNGLGIDYKTLFSNADKALYSVKMNGRGNYNYYTPEMDEMFANRKPIPRTPVDSDNYAVKYKAGSSIE